MSFAAAVYWTDAEQRSRWSVLLRQTQRVTPGHRHDLAPLHNVSNGSRSKHVIVLASVRSAGELVAAIDAGARRRGVGADVVAHERPHGTADEEVSYKRCVALVERSRASGGDVEIKTYPGATHSFDSPSQKRLTEHPQPRSAP